VICSHEGKFIFLKTRKTAGTSVELALSTLCGPEDIITTVTPEDEAIRREMGGRSPQHVAVPLARWSAKDYGRFALRGIRPRAHNHMPASDVRSLVGARAWSTYLKFTVVRNPWDAAISGLAFAGHASMEEFMASPRYAMLCDTWRVYAIGNRIVADEVIRYESLTEGFERVMRSLGLAAVPELPRAKGGFRTDRRPYQEVLTRPQAERIAKDFRREIEAFGYEF